MGKKFNKLALFGVILFGIILAGLLGSRNILIEQYGSNIVGGLVIGTIVFLLACIFKLRKNEELIKVGPSPSAPPAPLNGQEYDPYPFGFNERDRQYSQAESLNRSLNSMEFPDFESKQDVKQDVKDAVEEPVDWVKEVGKLVKSIEEKRKISDREKQAEYDNLVVSKDVLLREKRKISDLGRELKTQFLRLDNELVMVEKHMEMLEKAQVVKGVKK